MKILITGAEGRIGRILSEDLKDEHELVLLDLKSGINLLTCDIDSYFKGIDAIIHLAAHPEPWASKEQGEENLAITKRVYEAAKSRDVKRIIYASSINVYPYREIFNSDRRIDKNTPLQASVWNGKGFYGQSKIECEQLGNKYFEKIRGSSVINLRLGAVTEDDSLSKQDNGIISPIEEYICLKREDLKRAIRKALNFKGFGSYACVSKNKWFIDKNINFLYL